MQIIDGILAKTELTMNAMGGSELMLTRLYNSLPEEVFKGYHIINSRIDQYTGLREDLHRILILHDLPWDPASQHLAAEGWKNFHKLVFVSDWQMQQYIAMYQIPWDRCIVLKNSIVPIENHEKPKDKIRLGFWSTPHRGLDILIPVFEKLAEENPNIELDIFSSFALYGWGDRDAAFKELFDRVEAHPQMNLRGSVSNEQLREELKNIHILAYPNTWPETSCMVLMEAMSAGIACVHPNFAALPETAANWTFQYQWIEDRNAHANQFYRILKGIIEQYHDEGIQWRLDGQKQYADVFYNHSRRMAEWNALLTSDIKDMPLEFESRYLEFNT